MIKVESVNFFHTTLTVDTFVKAWGQASVALFPQAQLLLRFYLNFSETYQYSVLLIKSQLCQASTLRYLGEKLGVHCTFSVLFEDFSPTFLDSKPFSLEVPWGNLPGVHCTVQAVAAPGPLRLSQLATAPLPPRCSWQAFNSGCTKGERVGDGKGGQEFLAFFALSRYDPTCLAFFWCMIRPTHAWQTWHTKVPPFTLSLKSYSCSLGHWI